MYHATAPHAGFAILRRWAERMAAGSFVFTSNVDGHFQKAGFPPDRIVECHGSLEYMQCVAGCTASIWPSTEEAIEIDEATFRAAEPLPRCMHCGDLARLKVLTFDDYGLLPNRTERPT